MTSTTTEQQAPVRARVPRAASGFGNVYLFTARRFDAPTGLYYYRNRYYEPRSGRFISRDPLTLPTRLLEPTSPASATGGLRQYAAFENNPAKFRDPSGLYATILECVLDQFLLWLIGTGLLKGSQKSAEAYVKQYVNRKQAKKTVRRWSSKALTKTVERMAKGTMVRAGVVANSFVLAISVSVWLHACECSKVLTCMLCDPFTKQKTSYKVCAQYATKSVKNFFNPFHRPLIYPDAPDCKSVQKWFVARQKKRRAAHYKRLKKALERIEKKEKAMYGG